MWSQWYMRKPRYLDFTNFDVHKSMHHHMIQINQPTRCSSFISLLLDVYVWLNMFRAPLCPSSGVYNCNRSLWFYHWSVAVGALLVVVWQVILPDHDQCPLHFVLSPSSTLNKIWQQIYDIVCELTCLIPWDICLLSVSVWSIGPWQESWLTKNIWYEPTSPKIKKLWKANLFIAIRDFPFLLLNSPGTLEGIMGEWSARHSH
jgi:hypothetical protein